MFDALFNEGTFRFPSHEVSRFSLARVINMDVNIESARNDEFGFGYKLPFEKVISESAGYDFVQVMFDWAVKAQLKIDESFFLYRRQWVVSYDQFRKAHKTIASSLGFDPDRFSGKSSRFGGTCALIYMLVFPIHIFS